MTRWWFRLEIAALLLLLVTAPADPLHAQRPEGQALSLDGSGDFFQLSDHAAGLIFDGPATIEFWARADFNHKTSGGRIWAINDNNPSGDASNEEFEIRYGAHSSSFTDERIIIRYSQGTSANSTVFGYEDPVNYKGEWHHYAIVCAVDSFYLYINGLPAALIPNPTTGNTVPADYGAVVSPKTNVALGADYNAGSASGEFDGMIDEVRIWNVARSASQIQATMSDTLGPAYYATADSSLVGYWRFEVQEDLGIGGGGADDIRDLSLSGHHGDLAGQATIAAPTKLTDRFGRSVLSHGVTLLDWEGQIANPAIEVFVAPSPDLTYPVTVDIWAANPRLYFNNPGTVSPTGPAKTLTFNSSTPQSFFVAIFPDRDTLDELHTLSFQASDAGSTTENFFVELTVEDQDRVRPLDYHINIDYAEDPNGYGFFNDTAWQHVVQQGADDWAYYLADPGYDSVNINTERTYLWQDDFVTGAYVWNSFKYQGFLLYAYGIHTTVHRSGAAGSWGGNWQHIGGVQQVLRRSGEYEAEIHGDYDTDGWYRFQGDDDWLHTDNVTDGTNDLYSISMHEIGHALGFNSSSYPQFAAASSAGFMNDPEVVAYHGSAPPVDGSDHFGGVVDRLSMKGAYGNDYYGFNGTEGMPVKRWMITKMHILCLQAVGHPLRSTSVFDTLRIAPDPLVDGDSAVAYADTLERSGGIPGFEWTLASGSLPLGLMLNSVTGEISGVPEEGGTFPIDVRVVDYDYDTVVVSKSIHINGACPIVVSGDVDNSGSITAADIIAMVGYVFKSGAAPLPCEANGDVNCSGSVSSADVILSGKPRIQRWPATLRHLLSRPRYLVVSLIGVRVELFSGI